MNPSDPTRANLVALAIELAKREVGVRETARNRGTRVDEYIAAVGLDPHKGCYPWCVAFIQWCYQQAALVLGMSSPLPRTAGVHKLWNRSPAWLRLFPAAMPGHGAIFCIDHGEGKGHAGLIRQALADGSFATIEGNTSPAGSREGDGVYERTRQREEFSLGILDFRLQEPPSEDVA